MSSSWAYGKAISYAQEGDWANAQKQMNQLIVNAPDQADLLYDNGVAAYRLGEFQKAAAYFKEVTELPNVPDNLKKQAHFNLGNSNVTLNQLSDAIKQYQEVLAIDAENEPAKHNLAKVQEMLRQQQQKQQQNKQNTSENNDQQQNEQQNQEQSGQNSENQNQSQNDVENQNEKSRGPHEKESSDAVSQSNNQQENQQQPSGNTASHESQNKEQQQSMSGNQNEKNETNDQQKGDQESKTHKKSNQQNRNNKQNKFNNSHMPAPDQQKEKQEHKQSLKSGSQGTRNKDKEQAMQSGTDEQDALDAIQGEMHAWEQQLAPNEKWMAYALRYQAKEDENAQKAMIKMKVNNQLAGQNGQNGW
jgi:Ca-activated chloride channel family protein